MILPHLVVRLHGRGGRGKTLAAELLIEHLHQAPDGSLTIPTERFLGEPLIYHDKVTDTRTEFLRKAKRVGYIILDGCDLPAEWGISFEN